MNETKFYSTPEYVSIRPSNFVSYVKDSGELSYVKDTEQISCVKDIEQISCVKECKDNRNNPPWPVIIMAIVGFALVIYTCIGPNMNNHLIVFGALFIFLWTLMWCIILWVMWKARQYTETWGLLILPLVLVFLFFMIILVNW